MEEILSSIKRIIQEEGENPVRGRRAGRAVPTPAPSVVAEEEVLELSDPMPPHAPAADHVADHTGNEPPVAEHEEPEFEPTPEPTSESPDPEPIMPYPAAQTRPAPAEPLLSRETAEASRSALDNLSRMMVKPEAGSDGSLEGLVREMLRPMLREWLDTNLPPLVERMVEGEIARITGQAR